MSFIGLALLGYITYKDWLSMAYLGAIMGFVAGFMLDASAREKSLTDNFSLGIFMAGVLGYVDVYMGITDMTRSTLGQGFLMAMIGLAAIAWVGSLLDEIRVGRTVRISYMPTVAMLLALFVLFSAVSVNSAVTYTWTSYFEGSWITGVDVVSCYNDTVAPHTVPYAATPVINGTKVSSMSVDVDNAKIAYIELAIYRVSNTTWVRHAGTLEINFTMTLDTSIDDVRLLMLQGGNVMHETAMDFERNRTSLMGHAEVNLTSIDVYYANLADFVMLKIDVTDTAATSVTVSITGMAVVGERVLDKNMAYLALGLELIAALLAMPEDMSRRVRRTRRRKTSRR